MASEIRCSGYKGRRPNSPTTQNSTAVILLFASSKLFFVIWGNLFRKFYNLLMDFYHETINSEAFAHSSNLQCIVWGCGWAWGRDFLQRELSFHLADLQNRREYLYDKAKNRDFCLLIAAWLMQIPSKTSHIFIKRHFGPWSNYRVRCIWKVAY